tara:strand:- start:264 stop:692 length:429 start_codon:yes stop_codon:yes gene_type:complete
MRAYGKQSNLKKKLSNESQETTEEISKLNFQLIHQILNTINISLLVLVLTLFFLSFDSQQKWSNTYKNLSKTKLINNNLIDYISQTEEFYINELESLNTYRNTKPEDLIYLDKIVEIKESFLMKNIRNFIKGFLDSKYQKGY